MGSLIILLALPLDLFFQQVIQYPTVWVPAKAPATIARSITFTPPDQFFNLNGSDVLGTDPYMDLVTQPLFYSNGTLPDLTVSCPTSNCTFEPFETLAVCSACQDVSSELEFGCFHGPADWLSNFTDYIGDPSLYPNITQCGYFLNASSDSRVLMTGYEVDPTTLALGESLTTRWFPLIDAVTKVPYFDGSIHFKDIVNPIADFLVVGNPGGAQAVYQNVTPVAHECYLTWCTQTHKSSLIWGQLSQNITSVFMNSTKTPYPYVFFPPDPVTGEIDYDFVDNIYITPPKQDILSDQNHEDVTFGLSNTTALQMSFVLDTVQMAFLTADNTSAQPVYKYDNPSESKKRSLPFNPWLPPNNISAHVEKIATAMTIGIRNTPAVNGTLSVVTGTAWDSAVHVEIQWAWITLPLALLAFSLVFLLATVIKSSREESTVGIWKTSAIAILFNGLGEEVQRSVGPNCRMGQLRMKARELRVKLLPE
jgi:hypothetical protein